MDKLEILIPLLALPGFVLLWIVITSLIAVIGGWHGLAKAYPVPPRIYEEGVRYSFQSVRLGLFANYNSSVHVTVYHSGIVISPLFIFSVMHRPLFISFGSMRDPVPGKFLLHFINFRLGGKKIMIMGKSALIIKERLGQPASSRQY
jgi:hypothetical protein